MGRKASSSMMKPSWASRSNTIMCYITTKKISINLTTEQKITD